MWGNVKEASSFPSLSFEFLSDLLIDDAYSEYWLFLTLRTKIDKSIKKPSPKIAEVVYD